MTRLRLKSAHGARPKMAYVGVAERPFGDLGRQTRARRAKRALIREAETLARSGPVRDWKAASKHLRLLHERWKLVGSAGEEHDQRLWKRFKKAADQFRELRSEHFAKLDRERSERAALKEQLLIEASTLDSDGDHEIARGRLTDFMTRWQNIGHAGRRENELWERFVAARQAMYDATARSKSAHQQEYLKRVEERIREHREAIGKLRAERRELSIRRRSVIPGWVGLEMAEEFDERIERVDDHLAERERWLAEDRERLARVIESR